MPQTESVPDLVDDLLTDTVVESLLVVLDLSAVGGHPETVCRDDTALSVEVGETEDEVALPVEYVDIGQSDVLVASSDGLSYADESLGVVLAAPLVVCVLGNRLRRPGYDLRAEPLLEDITRRLNDVFREASDRNDIDTHYGKHLALTDNKACVERRENGAAIVGFVRDEYEEGARIIEVGVGARDGTARALAEAGFDVTATDRRGIDVHPSVEFVRDDVRSPDLNVYEGASLIYSLRPPYEIHADIDDVARAVGADTLLMPLADEGVSVDGFELVNRRGRALFLRRSDG